MADPLPRGLIRIGVAVGIGFVWTYIGGPIRVYLNSRMKARFDYTLVQLNQFLPDAQFYVANQVKELNRLGFETIAYLRNASVTNVEAYVVMLSNREASDRAMVTVIYSVVDGQTKMATQYVEYSTTFSDSSEIDTSNISAPSAFISGVDNRVTRLPGITDMATLYRVHQHLIETHALCKTKVLPEPGKELDSLQKNVRSSYERQVQTGLLQYVEKDDLYRPTFTGAYRMSYRQLFPFREMEMAERKRVEATLLREIAEKSKRLIRDSA